MTAEKPKTLRCAIYTRVSSDQGLDQEFNSLDNQREASEAFIKSQTHEGWVGLKHAYDDGGFSGGSLDRPALKTLLDDIRAKRVDVVVVYKVDRLTRSLADFAKLVELFDANGVSFVSVTQAFNTTSSMGRLTLNDRHSPDFATNRLANEFLATVPEPRKVSEAAPVFSATLLGLHVHERGSAVFPRETRADDLLSDRDANIAEATWRVLRTHFGLKGDRRDEDARRFVGRLFRVAFAILHAPSYQAEHKSALSADWAHLPIPKDADLFQRLTAAGTASREEAAPSSDRSSRTHR